MKFKVDHKEFDVQRGQYWINKRAWTLDCNYLYEHCIVIYGINLIKINPKTNDILIRVYFVDDKFDHFEFFHKYFFDSYRPMIKEEIEKVNAIKNIVEIL